jgi:hypothetical protein
MKKLVWLLVLINVTLLAYFNKDIIMPSVPKIALLAIHPEKISILTQQQINALSKKSAVATIPTAAAITPTTVDATATTSTTSAALPTPTKTTCYEYFQLPI